MSFFQKCKQEWFVIVLGAFASIGVKAAGEETMVFMGKPELAPFAASLWFAVLVTAVASYIRNVKLRKEVIH